MKGGAQPAPDEWVLGMGGHDRPSTLPNEGHVSFDGLIRRTAGSADIEARERERRTASSRLRDRCGFGSTNCPDAHGVAKLWCSETYVAGFDTEAKQAWWGFGR